MEDTVNPYRTIVVFLVEKDMVSDFMSQKPGFDDIVLYDQIVRYIVQTLDGGMNLPIIGDRLVFRPGFNGVVPDAIQIRNGFSG